SAGKWLTLRARRACGRSGWRRPRLREAAPLCARRLGEDFDQAGAHFIEVAGLAAGDQISVHDDGFVAHGGAGVLQVDLDRLPAGQGAALGEAGADQDLGAVADGADWFARIE